MADRVGVINKGELILVEDKTALMRKLGKKQLTLHLQQTSSTPCRPSLRAYRLTLAADGRELVYTYDTQGERTGITALLDELDPPRTSASRTSTPRRRSLEDIFVDLVRQGPMNYRGGLGDLPLRDGAHRPHALPEHRVAGDLDLALFRGVRRGHRLAHPGDRRHQLRLLHRAGADHDDAADAERHQRLVRHLFPEIHRHDLRAPVGADLVLRDRAGLCRRRRHQVDHPRPDHPRHRRPVRAAADRAPGLDDRVPGADGGDASACSASSSASGPTASRSCRSSRC